MAVHVRADAITRVDAERAADHYSDDDRTAFLEGLREGLAS